MSTIQPFNPCTIPISGTNLIEASAGTGKTYGIAALFTRLVIQENLPVDKILVVTFTKGATAELITRLRGWLDTSLYALQQSANLSSAIEKHARIRQICEDEKCETAAEIILNSLANETPERLILKLKVSIDQFDNASIFTIHGFFQRILRDYAFWCEAPFDMKIDNQSNKRLLEPAEDFWRKHVINNPLLAKLVFFKEKTPQSLLRNISSYISHPYLTFRRPENHFNETIKEAQNLWDNVNNQLKELSNLFWEHLPKLDGRSYQKAPFQKLFSTLETISLDDWLFNNKIDLTKLAYFDQNTLSSKLKGNQELDDKTYQKLQILADLDNILNKVSIEITNLFINLQLDMIDYINQAIEEQKKCQSNRSYDDLVLDVYHALTQSPHAESLAKAIADNWQVALIDEFQDTDPLQYEIFSRVFMQKNKPIFLVGDPKQAIYNFRGADIYAYINAAKNVQQHYTLATNFRSHSKLVNTVNALFKHKQQPFVLPEISYPDVQANRKNSRLSDGHAVNIRWLEKTSGVEDLKQQCVEYCADEIANALNLGMQGRLKISDKPIESGDITVLVRTNEQGRLMANELKKRNIASIIVQRVSVFSSEEAKALAALISFWLKPQQTDRLRFVLTSVLFSQTAEQIFELNQSESQLTKWTNSAVQSIKTWQQHGIYAAMQQFSQQYGLETGLLQKGNERSLTNYQQLIELLAEEDGQNPAPDALYRWFDENIKLSESQNVADNQTIRLESDEKLVKIITIHSSKGLQYPLVYCPFAWDFGTPKPKDWQIIHRNGKAELVASAQLTEEDKQQLISEQIAESLRLLYVALTRAEEQITIYVTQTKGNQPLAYLLQESEVIQANLESNLLSWAEFRQQQKDNDQLKNTDYFWTRKAPKPARLAGRTFSDGPYHAAEIQPRIFEQIRYASFTSLSSHTTEATNEDEIKPTIDAAEATTITLAKSVIETTSEHSIHDFPRGTQAGLCLHELLENFDFTQSASNQTQAIVSTLQRYGFATEWLPAVLSMLDVTRLTTLSNGHTLANTPAEQRLPEMGFTLHMSNFNLPHLRRWFAQNHLQLPQEFIAAAKSLDFNALSGFLNGFIDMTCQDNQGNICLIDYKSNYLGENENAYTESAMNSAMAEHHYYLQALIYAIAVARYFNTRGKPLNKISVRYLFLRGLNNQNNNGIWQWDINSADLAPWL